MIPRELLTLAGLVLRELFGDIVELRPVSEFCKRLFLLGMFLTLS